MEEHISIKTFSTGLLGSNCYVVSNNNEGFIIDAGSNDEEIFDYIEKNEIKIHYIFITHAHADHLFFGPLIKKRTGGTLIMHSDELAHFEYYTPEYIRSLFTDGSHQVEALPLLQEFLKIKADKLLSGNESFAIKNMKIEIMHTPGHSRGSICIYLNGKYLFSGDTMFLQRPGRTDITTGNPKDMAVSIKNLLSLPDNVEIFPGHGPAGVLKDVKQYFM